jgi:transcriptional regulator with XRE-family HTH domain
MLRLPIQGWCDALGISQVALARRAGITSSVISDYSRGRRNPTLNSIAALAKAIGRAPWEFLRGPLPGEGLPTEAEAREANLAWFRTLTPSQKAHASETSRKMVLRASVFAQAHGRRSARR